MTKIANIAKNTSYFTVALILQKLISLVYFTIYARVLGPGDLGKYYFALSFTTIFSIALDLGLTNLLTREVAKDQAQAGKFLAAALGAKILLSAATIIIIAVVIGVAGYSPLIVALIWVAVLSMISDSFTTLLFAFSRAFHNLKFESINAVISQAITLVVSLIVFKFTSNLVPLMWAQVASSVFAMGFAMFIIHGKWSLSLKPSWDLPFIKSLLLLAMPFGIYAIAQRFYNYLDSVMLFQLAGDTAVGIYQVPFRAVGAFQFFPVAFIASLYPALAHYWHNNREQLVVTFERAINYSLIIATPLAIGLAAIAAPVVAIFGNRFEASVLPLQASCLTIFFMFINYPVGALLNACDQQKANTRHMIMAAVASVILNLFLIPVWGVIGAVVTAILSTILLFGLNWLSALTVIQAKTGKVYRTFGKTLLASMLMGGAIYWLNHWLNVFVVVVIAVIVYFAALLLFGGFTKTDIQSVMKSFQTKK
ncbi:MAG: flippase [Candidatus Falkowbacteria bacterium]